MVISIKKYPILESLHQNQNPNYYFELPFQLKYGGIRPYPSDSLGKKDYSWLRNSGNLEYTFIIAHSIGLDMFISKEKYFKKNPTCYWGDDWKNLSLNDIVLSFIQSDTNNLGDYYSKFWMRITTVIINFEPWTSNYKLYQPIYSLKKSVIHARYSNSADQCTRLHF